MKKVIIMFLACITLASCAVHKPTTTNTVQLSGTIEPLGMSTFQYGTHLIKSSGITYSLKSNKVNLDSFSGKVVTLIGTKVNGYPVENGPELVDVVSVQVN